MVAESPSSVSAQQDQSGPVSAGARAHLMGTTAIVGGGATGGGVLHHLVQEYLDRLQTEPEDTPDLTIDLFEARGQYGIGGPYNTEPPVFRLNQPAGNMSIDRHNPGAFTAWFNEWLHNRPLSEVAKARSLYNQKAQEGLTESQIALHYPTEYILARRWRENDFLPRSFYGSYLRAEYAKTVALAEAVNQEVGRQALRIVQHNALVRKLEPGTDHALALEGQETGEYQQPFRIEADAAIIATGHLKNEFLAEHRDNPDYLDTPMTIAMVKERLTNLTDVSRPIIIAGTSQSMLDALAAIDAVGYQGKIIAVSPHAVEPWPNDPEKEAFPRTDYPLQHVGAASMMAIAAQHHGNIASAEEALRQSMVKEMHSPEAIKAGPGHVLATLRAQQAVWKDACSHCPGLYERFTSLIDELAGNSTFKERFDLYQRYKEEGRLEIRAGRINSAASSLPNGFEVGITDPVTGKQETILARKLINGASMLRTPYFIDQKTGHAHSPDAVVESALQNGLIAPDTVHKILNPSGPYADGTVASLARLMVACGAFPIPETPSKKRQKRR